MTWAEYRTGVQKVFFDPNKSLKFTVKDVVSKEDKRAHTSTAAGP